MPKDRRVNSSSFDRAMMSPYACSLKISDHTHPENNHSLAVGDESEWEEARCPICMEHPHNAVLLVCSSWEKGCRPFMCDTSYRHSNCLDQFLKSTSSLSQNEGRQQQRSEPVCPLCRGVVTRWVVVDAARKFMNSKARSCSLETCNFTGNYSELRKHARLEHPSSRPSEASPTRQSNWAELEHQRDFEDALVQQYDIDSDWNGYPDWDDWGEDDLWSDESFFNFDMSDIEDDMIDDIFGGSAFFSLSLGSLDLSSPEEDTMDSGSSGSSGIDQIRATATSSRSIDLAENGIPNSRSRSNYQRENASARSRSSYRREIDETESRTGSRYYRENGSTISRSRSNFHRENGSGNTRTGSGQRRETGPTYSGPRSTNRRGNGPTSFRTRSSYARRENQLNSGGRSRYSGPRDAPSVRRTSTRPYSSYPRQQQ